jgi:two-component system sensor histidine kinase TctE
LQQQTAPALVTWGDEGQLQMVILNLLKNARDALHDLPQPRTLALELQQGEQMLELTVSDNGPGIDPLQRQRLLQRWAQGDEGPALQNGSGLGLAIVSEYARIMGASLLLETADGGSGLKVGLLFKTPPSQRS